MKKVLALVLAFVMVFSTIPVAFADTEVSAEAKALATLGMLEGDGNGVTVEYTAKELTRLGAAAALLKLKGLYNEAIAFQGEDNFADVKDYAWVEGRNLMAYLKANPGLGFGGDEKGNFNPGAMINEQSYYKVLLETLGYKQTTSEVAGDFAWEEVFTFAESVGLKPAKAEKFTIDELAKATFAALKATTKDGKVYIDTLIAAGVVTEELAVAAGVKEEAPVLEAALKSAVALGNTVVEVTFDAAVNEGAEDVSLYTIEGLEVEDAIITGEKTVRLTTSAQEAGKKYTLVVGDVKVNFGGKAKVSGAPVLEKVTGPDTERVELEFDKTLDFVTATDKANYEIKDVEIVDVELDGDTVTLVTNGLTANKTHTVKVTGVKSVDGVALKSASKSFYSRSDKVAPKVTKAEAMTNTRVKVTFSEDVTKESATDIANYTIKAGSTELAIENIVVDEDNDNIVEITTAPQKGGTSYKLTVSGVVDQSVLGNEMTKEQTVSFMGKAEDKNAPTVKKVEIKSRYTVLVVFADNSRLDFATATDPANYTFNNDVTVEKAEKVAGTNADSKMILLTTSTLGEKSQYTLTVEGVADEYGNTISSVNKRVYYDKAKLDAARVTNVDTNGLNEIVVKFDDYVSPLTAKDVANFTINEGIGTPISAKVNDALDTVTLKVNTLTEGKEYKLTIDGVMDLAGNVLKQEVKFIARRESNDIEAPTVVDVYAVNKNVIRVIFSEEIKDQALTMTVKFENGNKTLDDFVLYDEEYDHNVAEFYTDTDLIDGNEYTIVAFTGVEDIAGNKLTVPVDSDGDPLFFWGDGSEAADIDFSWEQTAYNKITLTFSDRVKKIKNMRYATNYKTDDDGLTFEVTINAKPGSVLMDEDDINDYFEYVHGIADLIVNEDGVKDGGETTITADMEDDEAPYITNVYAKYRNAIKVEFNENIMSLAKAGSYELYYYDLNGKEKKIGVTKADLDDNVLTLTPSINLESRFEYRLYVTTGAYDLAGNQAEDKEDYYFMGTDLVEPANYIKGVTFVNGKEIKVELAKGYAATTFSLKQGNTDVASSVYNVTTDDNQVYTFKVNTNNNFVFKAGVDYTVKVGSYSYTFEGIVEEDVDVEEVATGEFVVIYEDAANGDVLVIDEGTTTPRVVTVGTTPGVTLDPDTKEVEVKITGLTTVNELLVLRHDVPLFYYQAD